MKSITTSVKRLHMAALMGGLVFSGTLGLFCPAASGQGMTLLYDDFDANRWAAWTVDQPHWPLTWYVSAMVHPVGTAYSGTYVLRANTYSVYFGDWARLHPSSSIDLSSYAGCSLELSFAMYHDNGLGFGNDRLTVQASSDEGGSWLDLQTFARYQPSSSHWTMHTVDLSSYAGRANFQFGLLGISDAGNDLYIDNIALTVVPEPRATLLLPLGIVAAWRLRRRTGAEPGHFSGRRVARPVCICGSVARRR